LLKYANKSTTFFTKTKFTFQGQKRKVVNNIFLQPTDSLFLPFSAFFLFYYLLCFARNKRITQTEERKSRDHLVKGSSPFFETLNGGVPSSLFKF